MTWEQEEYEESEFSGLDSPGQRIEGRTFESCAFSGCNFSSGEFKNCRFFNCRFDKCDFSNAKIGNCVFQKAGFQDCKLVGMNWPAAKAVSFLSFSNCSLNFSNFKTLDLRKGFSAENCTAKETDFAEANLEEAVFKGTDLTGAIFLKANLFKADFRQARNYSLLPAHCRLAKARFSFPDVMSLLYGMDIVIDGFSK